jgi:para-nitrobenzyl esterase
MIVDAPAGRFRGVEEATVQHYRGIRFARAARFAPPELVSAPAGVIDAVTFGFSAPQRSSPLEAMLGSQPLPTSEDCLYLNITTPSADDQQRPVMMWIHGGAFTSGSGSVNWYDGTRLAEAGDVVVVTVNYRLGAFGYLHLEPLLGSAYAGSGNCGTLDQLAALEWVKANIGAFGGDPKRITLFGESAGAMSIGTLISLPGVAPSLHAAILQSGTGDAAGTTDTASTVAELVLRHFQWPAHQAERLLEVSPDELLAAQGAASLAAMSSASEPMLAFRPVIDGTVVPLTPHEALGDGAAAGLPVVVGSTSEEWNLFATWERILQPVTEDGLRVRLTAALGDRAEEAVAVYRRKRPDADPHDLWAAVATDWMFRIPAIRLAEAQAATGTPGWVYEFGYRSTAFGGALGACHALDVPFVFDALDSPSVELFLGSVQPDARGLATTMSRSWLAFAHGRSPEHEGMPPWPRYDPGGSRSVLTFGPDCQVVDDPGHEERALWSDPS